MKEQEALMSLEFNGGYIDEINSINSDALICIIKKDLEGLRWCLEYVKQWRKENDDLHFPKSDYQKAIEYFIKKFEKGVK